MKWKFGLLIVVILLCVGYLILGEVKRGGEKGFLDSLQEFARIEEGVFEVKGEVAYRFGGKSLVGNFVFSGEKDEQRMKSDFFVSFGQKSDEVAESFDFSGAGNLFYENGEVRGELGSGVWFGGEGNVQNEHRNQILDQLKGQAIGVNLEQNSYWNQLKNDLLLLRKKNGIITLGDLHFYTQEKDGLWKGVSQEKTGENAFGELCGWREGEKLILQGILGKRRFEFIFSGDKRRGKLDFLIAEVQEKGERIEGSVSFLTKKGKMSLQSFAKSYTPVHEYLENLNISF